MGLFFVCLFVFLSVLRGMWDLSSPTRDQTCAPAPALEVLSLNPWTAREVPVLYIYFSKPQFFFFNFIYLFIYGCVGSSFLCEGFL